MGITTPELKLTLDRAEALRTRRAAHPLHTREDRAAILELFAHKEKVRARPASGLC